MRKAMDTFKPSCRRLAFGILLGLSLIGCSKKSETAAISLTSFETASPELKSKWKAGAEFAAQNNYLGAATNLAELFGAAQQLTPEQNAALTQAWEQLGNKAFEAANAGDRTATEAVLKMRDSKAAPRRDGR
jgi:hypothetical protein